MAIISRAELAKVLGISRPAVTMGIKAGRLVSRSDGAIDTTNPTNVAYIKGPRGPHGSKPRVAPPASAAPAGEHEKKKKPKKKPRGKHGTGSADKPDGEDSYTDPDDDIEESASDPDDGIKSPTDTERKMDLVTRRTEAEIRLKNAQTERLLLHRAERLGLLVLKSDIDKMTAVLGQELKTRLLDMPRRIVPQVYAMVESGQDSRAVEAYLDTELGDAIKHAKEAARRAGLDTL